MEYCTRINIDPKHTSRVCTEALTRAGIQWIKAPAKSPDLNIIELLWHSMLEYIRKKFCKTVLEVQMAFIEFSKTITPEIFQNYINKLPAVIKKVIEKKGGWSDY